jgi:8-oxo-dGTP diphosphatase
MPAMRNLKHKAFAYITHGDRLLVFRHPAAPDAGIQVPAGSVRAGETPEDAVVREAHEETGLTGLVLVCPLGEHRRDMSDFGLDEMHHRHFFHLRCTSTPPTTWHHHEREPSDGGSAPILFELFWARLPDGVPTLIADHGKHLPRLVELMMSEGLIGQPDPGS